MRTGWNTLSAVAAVSLMAAIVRPADAASDAFTNTTSGGSWEVGGNWSLGTPPGSADNAFLTNAGSYTVQINNTTADTDPGAGGWMTVQSLLIGNNNGTPVLFLDFTNALKALNLTSTTFGGSALSLGETAGTTGSLVMANGTLVTTNGYAAIGRTGIGSLVMSNGLFLSRYQILGVNAGALGTVSILGGTNYSNGGYLDIGSNIGATGSLLVANAYLRVTNGITYLGDYGVGILTTSNSLVDLDTVQMGWRPGGGTYGRWDLVGGTGRVHSTFTLGHIAGNTGIVNVVGGTLIADAQVNYVGYTGIGLMNLNGGSFHTKSLQVGALVGSSGQLNIINATNTAVGGYLYVGNNAGSTGIVNLAGGLLNVDFADTYIGSSGKGTINVSNGLYQGSVIHVGQLAGGNGELNLSGGKVVITNGYSAFGLIVANAAGSTGTVNITGGELVSSNHQNRIGNSGIGTMNISNGAFRSATQVLGVFAGGRGVVNLYNGGTNLITGTLLDIGSNVGATGIVNVAGGVLQLNPAISTTYFGDWGRGVINQTAGDVTLGYTLMGSLAGASGEWNISGGTGRVAGVGNSIFMGYIGGSTGVVNVSGGRFEVQQAFIGYSGGAYGELNVSGGSVVLGATTPYGLYVGFSGGSTGRVHLTGGEIVATNNFFAIGGAGNGTMIISNGMFRGRYQTLGVTASPNGGGALYQYGGTNLMESGYWDIGSNPGATGRVFIAGGYTRVTNGLTYLGDWGNGFLTVSNGVVDLDEVHMGELAAARGQMDLFGGRATMNGILRVGNIGGSTGLVQVADNGLLEIRSSIVVGNTGGLGAITNRDGGTVRFTGLNNPTITRNAGSIFVSTNAIVEFKDASAANLFGGVTNITLQGNNTLSLNNATNAILGSYTFQNNTPATYASLRMINGGTRWQSTNLAIAGGSSLLASNTIGTVRGIVTNAGTITVMNSKMTFENSVYISGSYVSDPSTNTFLSDVTVSQGGALAGGVGDLFDFKKSLFINSTNRFGFDLDKSGVMFSGGGMHTNAITGQDYGTNDLGYAANFAYGELHLGSATDQVCFTCGNIPTVASNGLYIGWLDLLGNSSLVTNLHSASGINLYYDLTDTRNAYLGGITYALTDCNFAPSGGFLAPVIPEPSALALVVVGLAGIFRRRK